MNTLRVCTVMGYDVKMEHMDVEGDLLDGVVSYMGEGDLTKEYIEERIKTQSWNGGEWFWDSRTRLVFETDIGFKAFCFV